MITSPLDLRSYFSPAGFRARRTTIDGTWNTDPLSVWVVLIFQPPDPTAKEEGGLISLASWYSMSQALNDVPEGGYGFFPQASPDYHWVHRPTSVVPAYIVSRNVPIVFQTVADLYLAAHPEWADHPPFKYVLPQS